MPSEAQHLMARMLPCGACGAERKSLLVSDGEPALHRGKCTACGTFTAPASTLPKAYENWQALARLRAERDELLQERGEYRAEIRRLQGAE